MSRDLELLQAISETVASMAEHRIAARRRAAMNEWRVSLREWDETICAPRQRPEHQTDAPTVH